jgi:hypothetical protein
MSVSELSLERRVKGKILSLRVSNDARMRVRECAGEDVQIQNRGASRARKEVVKLWLESVFTEKSALEPRLVGSIKI